MNYKIVSSRVFAVVLLLILALAGWIRLHNLITYTTWWADDGGAHLAYVEILRDAGRLPTSQETYLAWHEPGYYWLLGYWSLLADFFHVSQLQWMEFSQVLLGLVSVMLIGYISWRWTRNQLLVLIQTLLYSILFVGVKLSAYVTNELFAQILILLLIFLFIEWKLHERISWKYLFAWSLLLGLFLYIKLTILIVGIAALLYWALYSFFSRERRFLGAALVFVCCVGLIQSPWLIYKQQAFGTIFSINLYEPEKQSVLESNGWKYTFAVNSKVFISQPYWETEPWSFSSFIIADTVGDFYNLFNHVDLHNALPKELKTETSNGRFVTPALFHANLQVNRIGLVLFMLWGVGFISYVVVQYRTKQLSRRDMWLYLVVFGGIAALVYNTLRHPYYDRGVLKIQFVYFVLPLITLFSYQWWFVRCKSSISKAVVILLPVVVYLIVALPILLV